MSDKEIFLEKYTKDLIHLVPEYLRGNASFLVFFALMCHEYNITELNIKKFTDLINPDKVPIKFIESLGAFTNFHYQENASKEFNRLLLERNRKLYEDRGSNHSIIMAASHGDNEGYVGGDIFIPGYPVSDRLAEITVSRDRLFIHSKSDFSSIDVYSDDSTYRPGTLIVKLPTINASIRNKLWDVIPAGIKLKYSIFLDFIPNDDVYLSKFGTLSYANYFRVVPIPFHGDDKDSDNNPTNLIYQMDIVCTDIGNNLLVFSDGTYGSRSFFDENGILKSQQSINNISLYHGRKYRSGKMPIQSSQDNIFEIGVAALPLSHVRKPFYLSSIPSVYEIREVEELVNVESDPGTISTNVGIIPSSGIISSDENSLKHSNIVSISELSGSRKLSGNFEEIKKEVEYSYDLPEEEEVVDSEGEVVIVKRQVYNYFKITPTGEYEDRLDKLTADSVNRGLNTLLDLEYGSQKFHKIRKRSTYDGRHSGSVKHRDKYDIAYERFFIDNESLGTVSLLTKYLNHYATNRVFMLIRTMMFYVGDKYSVPDRGSLYGIINDILTQERNLSENIEIYNKAKNPIVKEDAKNAIESIKEDLVKLNQRLQKRWNSIISIHNNIIEILDTDNDERNKEYLKEYKRIFSLIEDNNFLLDGIDTGDISEYISISTMQPGDVLYPISEVLDKRPIPDIFSSLDEWDGNEETESLYGLKAIDDNRDPFYSYPIDISKDYLPKVGDSSTIKYYEDILGITDDIFHYKDIESEKTIKIFSELSGKYRSGSVILTVERERVDTGGTYHLVTPKMIHNKFMFSGGDVYSGIDADRVKAEALTQMYSDEESNVFIDLDSSMLKSLEELDVELDVTCEKFRINTSEFSKTFSDSRGSMSSRTFFNGKMLDVVNP